MKSFSRNLQNKLTKKEKIYFFGLGICTSLIARFNGIEFREDMGALWENFCIMERSKFIQTRQGKRNQYFWRTHDKKEIDYIEEYEGRIQGYEFKWTRNKAKKPDNFLATYPNSPSV